MPTHVHVLVQVVKSYGRMPVKTKFNTNYYIEHFRDTERTMFFALTY